MVESIDILGIVVGVATAVGILYSILQGVDSRKNEQKKYQIELLENLQHELTKIKETEKMLETDATDKQILKEIGTILRYASNYLNTMERIAFLNIKGFVEADTISLFRSDFEYALILKDWKILIKEAKQDYYSNLQIYCNENGIYLPKSYTLSVWLDRVLMMHRKGIDIFPGYRLSS